MKKSPDAASSHMRLLGVIVLAGLAAVEAAWGPGPHRQPHEYCLEHEHVGRGRRQRDRGRRGGAPGFVYRCRPGCGAGHE